MITYKSVICTVEVCPIGFKDGKDCPALRRLAKCYMQGTIGVCPVRKDYPVAAPVVESAPVDRLDAALQSLSAVKELQLF